MYSTHSSQVKDYLVNNVNSNTQNPEENFMVERGRDEADCVF